MFNIHKINRIDKEISIKGIVIKYFGLTFLENFKCDIYFNIEDKLSIRIDFMKKNQLIESFLFEKVESKYGEIFFSSSLANKEVLIVLNEEKINKLIKKIKSKYYVFIHKDEIQELIMDLIQNKSYCYKQLKKHPFVELMFLKDINISNSQKTVAELNDYYRHYYHHSSVSKYDLFRYVIAKSKNLSINFVKILEQEKYDDFNFILNNVLLKNLPLEVKNKLCNKNSEFLIRNFKSIFRNNKNLEQMESYIEYKLTNHKYLTFKEIIEIVYYFEEEIVNIKNLNELLNITLKVNDICDEIYNHVRIIERNNSDENEADYKYEFDNNETVKSTKNTAEAIFYIFKNFKNKELFIKEIFNMKRHMNKCEVFSHFEKKIIYTKSEEMKKFKEEILLNYIKGKEKINYHIKLPEYFINVDTKIQSESIVLLSDLTKRIYADYIEMITDKYNMQYQIENF